jgi:hypothetical protein
MELLTTILSAIPSVGFPVAAAIVMGVFIFRIYKRSEQREDILMKEITHTREVNAQAIETITKYADSIETIKTDISEIKTDITILRANGGN